jgi:hypothetical protein
MKLSLFLLTCLSILILSCQKADELEPSYDKKIQAASNAVNKKALVTIKTKYRNTNGLKVYFIVADTAGNILDSVEDNGLGGDYFLTSIVPISGKKVNVIQILKWSDGRTRVKVYANVPKGGTYSDYQEIVTTYPPFLAPVKIHFTNLSSFNNLNFSTDYYGASLTRVSDTSWHNNFSYPLTNQSKILVQLQKGEQAFHNYYDIKPGQIQTLDLKDCIIPSRSGVIATPGGHGNVNISGKESEGFVTKYHFGTSYYQGSSLKYFYPKEYAEYFVQHSYVKNNIQFNQANIQKKFPVKIEEFDASLSVENKSFNNFKATLSGDYDYSRADFYSSTASFEVNLPRGYNGFKLPDLSEYISIPAPQNLQLSSLTMSKIDGFSVQAMPYRAANDHTPNPLPRFIKSASIGYPIIFP